MRITTVLLVGLGLLVLVSGKSPPSTHQFSRGAPDAGTFHRELALIVTATR